ncbi:MAG: winged helix-turn-helix domain-containing protein [Nitrososphaerales archaeon]
MGPRKLAPDGRGRRTSLDIMTDLLTILSSNPCGKTQLMYRVNLSYRQCSKYLEILENLGVVQKFLQNGVKHFSITPKGELYLFDMSRDFGSISEGEDSVWESRSAESPKVISEISP